MPKEGSKKTRVITVVVVGAAAAAVAVSVGSARDTRSAAKTCAFTLRIGDVLPFTGDLAAYGANLDRAVKATVALRTWR